MTREEAIRWLTNEKWKNANNKYKREWNEAFDMAIEALSLANLKEEFESAVAVVRCKDCEYKRLYDERLYDEGETKYYYCALEDRPNRNWSVDDTDYCSWAEKSEVEE